MKSKLLCMTAFIMSCLLLQPVEAAVSARGTVENAVSNCQGALPAFEGAFRKRPLGILNEGASPAFITCAWSVQLIGSLGLTELSLFFMNQRRDSVAVTCALVVDGTFDLRPLTTLIKTQMLPPVTPRAVSIRWVALDNGNRHLRTSAVSCEIPPGVEVRHANFAYASDVGDF